jgi:hypothetical protein
MKGVAAADSSYRQQAAAEQAPSFKRVNGILRASRVKTTLVTDERAERPLINFYAHNA